LSGGSLQILFAEDLMKKNKWMNGFIPMVLMSFSTGSVYCWTLFREDIGALHPVFTPEILTLCFMLALFFLGMTAAFGGRLVEKSVKRASLYTFAFFTAGWLITGIGVQTGRERERRDSPAPSQYA